MRTGIFALSGGQRKDGAIWSVVEKGVKSLRGLHVDLGAGCY